MVTELFNVFTPLDYLSPFCIYCYLLFDIVKDIRLGRQYVWVTYWLFMHAIIIHWPIPFAHSFFFVHMLRRKCGDFVGSKRNTVASNHCPSRKKKFTCWEKWLYKIPVEIFFGVPNTQPTNLITKKKAERKTFSRILVLGQSLTFQDIRVHTTSRLPKRLGLCVAFNQTGGWILRCEQPMMN